MNTRRAISFSAVLAAALLSAHAWAADAPPDGVPNFFKVDEHVYRGGQPLEQGWSNLARLGVKTVIDLRYTGEHSTTDEARMVEAAGMRYVSVPMHGFGAPKPETLTKALDVMNAGETVFVHCKLGKDRTGTVVAAYRIQHAGWTSDKALAEAHDCGIHWYSGAMKSFIRSYRAPAVALAQTQTSGDSMATGAARPATVASEPQAAPKSEPGDSER